MIARFFSSSRLPLSILLPFLLFFFFNSFLLRATSSSYWNHHTEASRTKLVDLVRVLESPKLSTPTNYLFSIVLCLRETFGIFTAHVRKCTRILWIVSVRLGVLTSRGNEPRLLVSFPTYFSLVTASSTWDNDRGAAYRESRITRETCRDRERPRKGSIDQTEDQSDN